MTMWHCVVAGKENLLCNGTPEWEKEPVAMKEIVKGENGEKREEILYYAGGTCKLLPDTCGKSKVPEKVILMTSSYTHKIISKKGEAKFNPKTKSEKALEKEKAQHRMF